MCFSPFNFRAVPLAVEPINSDTAEVKVVIITEDDQVYSTLTA